jgi:hypothetical protein
MVNKLKNKELLIFGCFLMCYCTSNRHDNDSMKEMATDFPPNPIDKIDYVLEFQDEFDDSELNLKNWIPYYLPQWSSRERSKPTYKMKNGNLILTIEKNQQPWCPEFNGDVKVSSLQTGLFSGPLNSKIGQHRFNTECTVREEQKNVKKYVPQHGYIEIRCRGNIGLNNVIALWMIGYEDMPHRSGEICIVEIKGKNIQNDSTTVGYGVHPFSDPELKDEFYEDRFNIQTSAYHIYAADWTPTQVDFYIDNVKTKTIYQSPKYPMQLMLNIYELPDSASKKNTYPATFEIDYVRGYKSKQQ